jgi:hypothetical protein
MQELQDTRRNATSKQMIKQVKFNKLPWRMGQKWP